MTTAAPNPPPELMEAMHHIRAGKTADALEIIEKALGQTTNRGPFLALGSLAALRLGDAKAATPMLRELVKLDPSDRASRNNLAAALVQLEEFDEAMKIAAGSSDPALARIEGFIHQDRGNLEEAADAYRRAILAEPRDLASLNNLGNVLTTLERFDQAIAAFERSIALAPADIQIYLNLADCLRIADRPLARVKVLEDAREKAPRDVRVLTDLGMAYAHAEDLDKALETYRTAVDLTEGFGEAHIEYGVVLEKLNRTEELTELVKSFDRESAPPEASYLLAWNAMRTGDFQAAARLAAEIPENVLPNRRWQLIGSAADRLEQSARAFGAFEKMNASAVAEARPLTGRTYRERVEAELEGWTDQWAARWNEPPIARDAIRDPIFLVGFPRSGTTLLDTMLMGLDATTVLEERPLVARLAAATSGEDIADMKAERVAELRKYYFDMARDEGWSESTRLVDKHPLNMQRVPLIHRLFPDARFILAERHPNDVVLSCFMANFRLNNAMRSFTELEETARTYDAVWRSWQRAVKLFAVEWHPVRYERLVTDPRSELKQLLDFLEIEWSESVLDHTSVAKRRGRVRTASYSQIQEDLYSRALARWRRYEDQLAPVIPILQPWIDSMGYGDEGASR